MIFLTLLNQFSFDCSNLSTFDLHNKSNINDEWNWTDICSRLGTCSRRFSRKHAYLSRICKRRRVRQRDGSWYGIKLEVWGKFDVKHRWIFPSVSSLLISSRSDVKWHCPENSWRRINSNMISCFSIVCQRKIK